ncbi:MAG: hypothetical protein CVV53_00985 [Spirochaetae bacterium HGW-Spirochaetae-9]|nr:MAG: hypothetical protein CVV53_00985 [Spirochaetae bacterium HGW-Spirochaetae-9]
MKPHEWQYSEWEETLLAMVLFRPSTLNQLHVDLFDAPGYRAIYEAMRSMRDRCEAITRATVQQAAGRWANDVPEPWFTVANIAFYLTKLEGRRRQKERRSQLIDELHAMDEGGNFDFQRIQAT